MQNYAYLVFCILWYALQPGFWYLRAFSFLVLIEPVWVRRSDCLILMNLYCPNQPGLISGTLEYFLLFQVEIGSV